MQVFKRCICLANYLHNFTDFAKMSFPCESFCFSCCLCDCSSPHFDSFALVSERTALLLPAFPESQTDSFHSWTSFGLKMVRCVCVCVCVCEFGFPCGFCVLQLGSSISSFRTSRPVLFRVFGKCWQVERKRHGFVALKGLRSADGEG